MTSTRENDVGDTVEAERGPSGAVSLHLLL